MQCKNDHRMKVIKSVSWKQTTCRQYRCPICGETAYTTEQTAGGDKDKLLKIRAKKRNLLIFAEK